MSDSDLVKIRFRLDPEAWHGSASETLWAKKMKDGNYSIQNTPFYAFGVSLNDEVAATPVAGSEVLDFVKKIRSSRHSSYRTMPKANVDEDLMQAPIAALNDLGVFFEEGPSGLLAFDIPPSVDIERAYRIFESYCDRGVWHFEEGHFGRDD